MAKVENLDAPLGWLIDPHNKWAIHFDFKKDSTDQKGQVFTIDMWGVDHSSRPIKFNSRRKATRIDSIKTWNQLISSNWSKLDSGKIKSA
tara:strand:+ start:653 stop:922 length:270 start_codon:yes stop_codon:yes gene_type:complete